MHLAILLAILSWLIAAPQSVAQERSKEFSAVVALSCDPTIRDRWDHTQPAQGVQVITSPRVVRGQAFRVLVFLMNCPTSDSGAADVRVDITITRPDGKVYHERKDLSAYRGRVGGAAVLLSQNLLGVSFDPQDPLGKYEVSVVARDLTAQLESKCSSSIELVERIDGKPFASGPDAVKSVIAWSMSPKAPNEPERLMDALRILAEGKIFSVQSRAENMRAFFRAAFDTHPFLFPQLAALAADESSEASARDEARRLLATCRTDEAKRWKGVSAELRKQCEALATEVPWDPMADDVTEPGHLDLLWVTFFATGKFAVLERIAAVLDLDPTKSKQDEMIHGAVCWSMKSIASQHDLARAYLEGMHKDARTPAARKKLLGEILAD